MEGKENVCLKNQSIQPLTPGGRYRGVDFIRFGDERNLGHFLVDINNNYLQKKYITHGRQRWSNFVLLIRVLYASSR